MGEDDGNPYPHHRDCGTKPQMCLACVWNESRHKFAEKVEKKLEKLERELNKTSQFGRGMQMGYHKVLDIIDNTLKEKGED